MINCKGDLIDFATPKVMGILNITPDSFYDGGRYGSHKLIITQVEKMLRDGATFIDIGGYSSRPGAKHITTSEELERILPIVQLIIKHFPESYISIDTFRSEVAKACIAEGACMINDIAAASMDEHMLPTVAALQVPYIMMHMQGTPQTMQLNPEYDNIITDIIYYFSEKLAQARALGINDLIIDPGFGFGKTIAHNYTMLKHLDLFSSLNVPLLAGLSRKSMIYKVLETSPKEALNGSTALHMTALLKGAQILRVHDVKEAVECVTLFKEISK